MASEDVIELGSSEDEAAEPTIKKIKPLPNAMVHIPTKLHGVTIKPAKANPLSIPKELAGKNVTVTKISRAMNILSNPFGNKVKTRRRPAQIVRPSFVQLDKSVTPQHTAVNPLNIIKKINSQVVINKVTTNLNAQNPIKVQSPDAINNLSPSITITRTKGGVKRPGTTNLINPLRKKPKGTAIIKSPLGKVLTVELDDDEMSPASTSSPQWYLRPEETESLEEVNNREPESTNEIEITIEDSPVKPVQNKRALELGTELSITIDDSPVKSVLEKNAASGSDVEDKSDIKVPHSKKKLEYPKESETAKETIEIEITPIEVTETNDKVATDKKECQADTVIEIEESPMKNGEGQGPSTPKKDRTKPHLDAGAAIKELTEDDELSEFHPVYGDFIKLCFQLENSDDMKKIVEKKIKTYYRQVPKDYTESEDFTDMVSSKILAMKAGPEKMYLYIKDIVDELNLQRKMAKSQIINNVVTKAASTGSENYVYGEENEYDSKRQRQIRKLEKTLKKLHRAIQKLEEQEVDLDEEEDSVYLLTESDDGSTDKDTDIQLEKDPKVLLQRYKERMVRVHAKFCQLTNSKMPSEPRVLVDARPGQPTGPAKRLEKWVNKKVPIGTPLPFPDFYDVLRCVREANEQDKLGWNEAEIMEEARDLFTRCGRKLQRRRQENEWRLAASRISVDTDPAENNPELKKMLQENMKVASKKEAEVLNKYADRQSQLKLEAVEIGDKEADESPIESDDEENNDESPLENKEKRKERLIRLLQEKTKKTTSDKEIESNESKDQKDVELAAINDNQEPKNNVKDLLSTEIKKTYKLENKDKHALIETEKQKESSEDDVQWLQHDRIEIDNPEIIVKPKEQTGNSKMENNSLKLVDTDKIHSLSDESGKVESDVDELHLLQKLHSENEINTSNWETTDSETRIAISDSLSSSEENTKQASDVISIENSSYSETDTSKDVKESNVVSKIPVDEVMDTELECPIGNTEKRQLRTNNDEYNESIEDILLASTDEEAELDKDHANNGKTECVNLKDDSISIGETIVEGMEKTQNSNSDQQDCLKNNFSSFNNKVDSKVTENNICSDSVEKHDSISSVDSVAFVDDLNGNAVDKNEGYLDRNCTAGSYSARKQIEVPEEKLENDREHSNGEGMLAMAVDSSILAKDLNDAPDNDNAEKHDDISSVDSVAFVATKEDSRDALSEENAPINIIESDSTERQDDVTSVESVAYVSSKDDSQDCEINDNKEDEHLGDNVESSDRMNKNASNIENTDITNTEHILEQSTVAVVEAMDVDVPAINKSIEPENKVIEEVGT